MTELKTVYVRVNPRKRKEPFFRAGLQFTNEWQKVEADEATIGVLQREQMLEVTGVDPTVDAEKEAAPVKVVEESDPLKVAEKSTSGDAIETPSALDVAAYIGEEAPATIDEANADKDLAPVEEVGAPTVAKKPAKK